MACTCLKRIVFDEFFDATNDVNKPVVVIVTNVSWCDRKHANQFLNKIKKQKYNKMYKMLNKLQQKNLNNNFY